MAKDTISKASPKIVATPTASEQQPEDGLASFSVYIPKCLLGERMIRAADETDATPDDTRNLAGFGDESTRS